MARRYRKTRGGVVVVAVVRVAVAKLGHTSSLAYGRSRHKAAKKENNRPAVKEEEAVQNRTLYRNRAKMFALRRCGKDSGYNQLAKLVVR
jgi:hypothetical protein